MLIINSESNIISIYQNLYKKEDTEKVDEGTKQGSSRSFKQTMQFLQSNTHCSPAKQEIE